MSRRLIIPLLGLSLFLPGILGAAVSPAQGQPGFYVAVAPYVTTTHPCTYHVNGSCQAELKHTLLRFWLRSTDGAVNRAGMVRAGADGFVEWWLPHNKEYIVTFAYDGKRGTGSFTSYPQAPTCITTIWLTTPR
jgi:hypothetical protein